MEQGFRLTTLTNKLVHTGTYVIWKKFNGSRWNLKTHTFFVRIIVQPIGIISELKKHSFRNEWEIPRTICQTEITSVPVNLTKSGNSNNQSISKRTTAENKVILLYLTLWVRFHLPTLSTQDQGLTKLRRFVCCGGCLSWRLSICDIQNDTWIYSGSYFKKKFR